MRGRLLQRRGPASSLLALVFVLALALVTVVVPSARAGAPAVAGGEAPVASAVDLVGDVLLPAPAGPSFELRTRLLGPVDLLVVVLLVAVTRLGVAAAVERARRTAFDPSVVLAAGARRRAPPSPLLHR